MVKNWMILGESVLGKCMVGLIDTFGVGMVKSYRGEKVRESITRLLNFRLKIHAESSGPWITSPFHITTSAIVVPTFSLINSFALWTEKKEKSRHCLLARAQESSKGCIWNLCLAAQLGKQRGGYIWNACLAAQLGKRRYSQGIVLFFLA